MASFIVRNISLAACEKYNDIIASGQTYIKNICVSQKHRIIVVLTEIRTLAYDNGHVRAFDLDTLRCITHHIFTYKPTYSELTVDICIDDETHILEILVNDHKQRHQYDHSYIMRYSINRNRNKIIHKLPGKLKMEQTWTQLKTYHNSENEIIRIVYGDDFPGHDNYLVDYHGRIMHKITDVFLKTVPDMCFSLSERCIYYCVRSYRGNSFHLKKGMLDEKCKPNEYWYDSMEYVLHDDNYYCMKMTMSEKWKMIFVVAYRERGDQPSQLYVFNLRLGCIFSNKSIDIKRIIPLDSEKELKVLCVSLDETVSITKLNLQVEVHSLQKICINKMIEYGKRIPQYLLY